MEKIDANLRDALEQSIQEGLSDETLEQFRKKVRDVSCEFEESLMWSLKDNLAYNLAAWVADMAERAVEQMLLGNEDQMRRYLSCDKRGEDGKYICYPGRSDGYCNSRSIGEQHPVIHGRLFETGAIELRKKVAQANEALIRDERIKDLEDQIKSLVEQVNKANNERANMWERLRAAQVDA